MYVLDKLNKNYNYFSGLDSKFRHFPIAILPSLIRLPHFLLGTVNADVVDHKNWIVYAIEFLKMAT